MKTYDIINAGPRNRFMAGGKIVSNSGFWYNLQNLPRILRSAPKLSDALRYSLMAPPGYKVVVADLSGIELRVNMTLWKVPYAMELLAADPEADLYKSLASEVLGVPIEDMPKMVRQAGKAMHLGAGFGLGSAEKYVGVAKQIAQIVVTPEEAATHIAGYRAKHPEVVQGWKTCHRALDYVYSGNEAQIDPWGLCHTSKEGIVTPKGVIRYPDLRKEMNEDSGKVEWVYGTGRKKARIYGPKVDENIVQHLARNVLSDNMIEVRRQTEYWPVHTVHDELIYIVPEDQAQIMLDAVQAVMRTPPVWWPELVVYSEGSFGDNYGEAK